MEEELTPDAGIQASCNWLTISGCNLSQAVQEQIFNEDVFIRPAVDEILSEDKAILLSPPPDSLESCELNIRTNGRLKVAAISLICSSSKIELFLSHQYEETIYGTIIKEDEVDTEQIIDEAQDDMMQSYRYDVEVAKSGITDITLKFITQSKEICIYGIVLFVAPNPNGVTTLNSQAINLENVEEMLKSSGHKISSNAEKCKLFLEFYSKNNAMTSQSSNNPSSLLHHLKQAMSERNQSASSSNSSSAVESKSLENAIKIYVDLKVNDLEKKLESRLNAMEKSLNEKLDKIIELISKQN